jgi:hypothetical protein
MIGVSSAKHYAGVQMKDDEMGGSCGMYGVEGKCTQRFSGEM